MLKARDEAKRKLEEKFKEVYRKIKENKEHTVAVGRKFNENLKSYEKDFN